MKKKIKLILITKEVQVEPRVIKTDWSWQMGTPVFGMCKAARKKLGLKKGKKYREWQKQMRKSWKKSMN